jgi:hypothetical protein
MELSHLGRVLTTAVILLLAGCGGQVAPTGMTGTGLASSATHGKSWMLPGTSGAALIYLSGQDVSEYRVVYVLSYTTGKLVGQLKGFGAPWGLCVDKSGDVWVVDYTESEVNEYAHGGTTQIASLPVPGIGPIGCAVDPTTGNLAVTSNSGTYKGDIVSVYQNAQGTPVTYTVQARLLFCSYDNASNLLISVNQEQGTPRLYELLRGSSTLTEVSFDKNVLFHQSPTIQWDGTAFAYGGTRVGHKGPHTIYQLTISGNEAKRSGTTHLSNSGAGGGGSQFWVQGNAVVQAAGTHVGVWHYPGGRKPIKLFTIPVGYKSGPGIAISEPPSR